MSIQRDTGQVAVREGVLRAAAGGLTAVERLAGGLGTAFLALTVTVWVLLTLAACLVGIGLPAARAALRLVRALADRERARLGTWGPELFTPGPVPPRLLDAVRSRAVHRELQWLALHATAGLILGVFGVLLPLLAVRDVTFPLWWQLMPEGTANASIGIWYVHDWVGAFAVMLLGLGWAAIIVGVAPGMARLQARPGRLLLRPDGEADLSLRIARLTATRAAALDAHAVELRRIERSLHDGSQNRLVAVAVLLGAARRVLPRDPAAADEILERAQGAAEQALAELRAVVRSILPPVLLDRGLAGALTGLAATCSVPCEVDVDVAGRCAASVESTAYFVVAEALTNISRHSHARHASVVVRRDGTRLRLAVTDDGAGGADERRGSGLGGIRSRVEAHDGTLTLTSPPGGPTTLEVDLPCGL